MTVEPTWLNVATPVNREEPLVSWKFHFPVELTGAAWTTVAHTAATATAATAKNAILFTIDPPCRGFATAGHRTLGSCTSRSDPAPTKTPPQGAAFGLIVPDLNVVFTWS